MSLLVPALVRMSLRSSLRGRRFVMALLVSLIPAALGFALIAADGSTHAEQFPGRNDFEANFIGPVAYLILGGTVPFVALLLAGTLVADDVEDRTFSYLLVRPIRRHQIYLSRLVPALAVAAAFALLQVLTFALLRILSWSLYGQGSTDAVRLASATVIRPTIDVLLLDLPVALGAAALAAMAFLALFAFVTVLTTKYHFLANILIFAAVELPFGNLGGRGAGVVTVTYHSRSLLYALHPEPGYHPAYWLLAAVVLLGMVALWTWLASRRMGTRDFNITSAAT